MSQDEFEEKLYRAFLKALNELANHEADYLISLTAAADTEDVWREILNRLVKPVVEAGYQNFSPLFTSENLVRYVENRMLKLEQMARTTLNKVAQIVTQASLEGVDNATKARRIREQLPAFNRNRAITAARTETIGVFNESTLINAQDSEDSPFLFKVWNSSEDAKVRPSHAAADQQVVRINDDFNIGGKAMSFPGDSRGYPENVDCRCYITTGTEEDLGLT